MRDVFAAAAAGTTAYRGEVPPERSRLPNDWRRFLDLTEELGGRPGVADARATWALGPEAARLLPARDAARRAYARPGGRPAARGRRRSWSGWRSTAGTSRTPPTSSTRRRAILATRDEIGALADARGPRPGRRPRGGLRGRREQRRAGGHGRARRGDASGSCGSSPTRPVAVDAPRDWLTDLGLDGSDPAAGVASARDAWERGDLDTARAAVAAALVRLASAPGVGRSRALAIGGATGDRDRAPRPAGHRAAAAAARGMAGRRAPAAAARRRPPAAPRTGRDRTLHSRRRDPRPRLPAGRHPVTKERTDRDHPRRPASRAAPDGPAAHPPVARDPVGRDGRRLLRPCQQHPRPRGARPGRPDGGLLPRGRRPVRHGRGDQPDRPRARERARRRRRGARGRRPRHAQGGRPPDPGALPGLRPVRDGDAGHARAVHRLGDRGPPVRRGRRRAARDLVRGAARPPRHHRRPRLRGDRRRVRRRIDARPGPGSPASTPRAPCPTRWC